MASHFALLAAQGFAVAAMSMFMMPLDGFPLDDAWIHQVIARNVSTHGVLGFDPGRPGSAATSLLWAALVSLNYLTVQVSPPHFSLVINLILYVATGQMVLRLLRNDGVDPVPALGAACLFSLSGNLLWFAFSGMEATLFLFLVVLAVSLWMAPAPSPATAAGGGMALAALGWTRPEAFVLAPLLLLLGARRRPVRDLWLASAIVGTAGACYAAFNLWSTGTLAPPTLEGRRWMWLFSRNGASWPQQIEMLARGWMIRLMEFVVGTRNTLVFDAWVGLALAGATLAMVRWTRARALIAMAAVHVVTYAILLPVEGHGGRYQPFVPGLFPALAGLGLTYGIGAAVGLLGVRTWRPMAQAIALGLLIWPVTESTIGWGREHWRAVVHIRQTEEEAGRRVNRLPPGRVASFDIGGIGFHSKRAIIDLGGLVDPAIALDLKNGSIAKRLREWRVDYVILPLGYNVRYPDPWNFGLLLRILDDPGLRLEEVDEFTSHPVVWLGGLRATLHGAPRQVIYRLHFAPGSAG